MKTIESRKIWEIDRSYTGKGGRVGGEVHPDLIRHRGHWYCGFKESGRSRIIRSTDGVTWETVKLFDWDGAFNGRPYLSVTAEGLLMVNSWVNPQGPAARLRTNGGDTRIRRQFAVSWLSEDGLNWSSCHAVSLPLYFSTTWSSGVGYSFGTDGTLYYTLDGKCWSVMAENQYPDREPEVAHDPHDTALKQGSVVHACSECGLAFDPVDGMSIGLLRTNPICAMIGTATTPDYADWTWREARVDWEGDGQLVPAQEVMGVQLGGPLLKFLSDGRLMGAGRAACSTPEEAKARVVLFWVDPVRAVLTPFAKLDGFGHYSGIVEHEGELWVACGNETQRDAFEVFLVKLRVPGKSEPQSVL